MYAIVEVGGMQFQVAKEATICVPKMKQDPGKKVEFDRVLMIVDGDKVDVGTPMVANAVVKATVVSHFKDDKVLVFKKKRRKDYKVLRGHRQQITELKIDAISVGKEAGKKEAKPAEKKTEVKPDAPTVKKSAETKASQPKKPAASNATPKAASKKAEAKPKTTTEKKTAVKKPAATAKVKKASSKPSEKKEA